MKGYAVVDASLAVKWVLKEPYTEEALSLGDRWLAEETKPIAPCLLFIEITNVLHRRAIKGQISLSHAEHLLKGLLNMGIEIWESPRLHIRALQLAQKLQRTSVYDAHYLALAEIMDCEFWTADERFFNSVREQQPRVKWLGHHEKQG